MPETYTGDEGTEAANAGYSAADGTEDRRDGWLAINRTRDYVAQVKAWAQAQIAAISLTWDAITGKPSTFPPSGHVHDVGQVTSGGQQLSSRIWFHTGSTTLRSAGDAAQLWVTDAGTVYTGNTFMLPNASAATSGYTVAYINGDGRVSRGASSERYKKFISTIDPASLGDLWPDLVRYQMRNGDGTWKYGYIAERLDESDDLRPFVVYNTDDQPDSIDFIALLMAQNAQLHQAVELLAQRLDNLEADHADH